MRGDETQGRREIYDDHNTVDLPKGLPKNLLAILKRTRVAGQPLATSRAGEGAPPSKGPDKKSRPFDAPRAEGAPRPFKLREAGDKTFKLRPAGDKPFKPKARPGHPKRKTGEAK